MAAANAQSDFNPSKAEALAERFPAALNNGALCLMDSIGHPVRWPE